MTVQDENTTASDEETPTDRNEPESVDRVPWSELAQEFAETWGRADPGNPQPEHVEVI